MLTAKRLIRTSLVLLLSLLILGILSCDWLKSLGKVFVTIHEKTIELEVMSYNIYRKSTGDPDWKKWRNRRDEVVAKIRRFSPDVVGLQEAYLSQINYIVGQLTNYGWVGVGRNDGNVSGEFAAILYNKARFHIHSEGTFWFSETPDTPSKGGSAWGQPVLQAHLYVGSPH